MTDTQQRKDIRTTDPDRAGSDHAGPDRAGFERARGGARSDTQSTNSFGWLGQIIGHTRFVVLIAVIAVLMVAVSLFVLGAVEAFTTVWHAWVNTFQGDQAPHLAADFLGIVIIMLEAVVFFVIGVGLYSLFIAPLNLAIALGVESINDLEEYVISVVVAVLAVTFLQHFIRWEAPQETLQFGAALAVAVGSLVLFQRYSHHAKEDKKHHKPEIQRRSKREMFEEDEERHEIKPDDAGNEQPGKDSANRD